MISLGSSIFNNQLKGIVYKAWSVLSSGMFFSKAFSYKVNRSVPVISRRNIPSSTCSNSDSINKVYHFHFQYMRAGWISVISTTWNNSLCVKPIPSRLMVSSIFFPVLMGRCYCSNIMASQVVELMICFTVSATGLLSVASEFFSGGFLFFRKHCTSREYLHHHCSQIRRKFFLMPMQLRWYKHKRFAIDGFLCFSRNSFLSRHVPVWWRSLSLVSDGFVEAKWFCCQQPAICLPASPPPYTSEDLAFVCVQPTLDGASRFLHGYNSHLSRYYRGLFVCLLPIFTTGAIPYKRAFLMPTLELPIRHFELAEQPQGNHRLPCSEKVHVRKDGTVPSNDLDTGSSSVCSGIYIWRRNQSTGISISHSVQCFCDVFGTVGIFRCNRAASQRCSRLKDRACCQRRRIFIRIKIQQVLHDGSSRINCRASGVENKCRIFSQFSIPFPSPIQMLQNDNLPAWLCCALLFRRYSL